MLSAIKQLKLHLPLKELVIRFRWIFVDIFHAYMQCSNDCSNCLPVLFKSTLHFDVRVVWRSFKKYFFFLSFHSRLQCSHETSDQMCTKCITVSIFLFQLVFLSPNRIRLLELVVQRKKTFSSNSPLIIDNYILAWGAHRWQNHWHILAGRQTYRLTFVYSLHRHSILCVCII